MTPDEKINWLVLTIVAITVIYGITILMCAGGISRLFDRVRNLEEMLVDRTVSEHKRKA